MKSHVAGQIEFIFNRNHYTKRRDNKGGFPAWKDTCMTNTSSLPRLNGWNIESFD